MDRRSRRYIPSSEGLEGRQVLSAASAAASTLNGALNVANAVNGGNTTPTNSLITATPGQQLEGASASQETIEAKLHRIENLPYFIGLLNKDHVVPQPAVANLQADLLTEVAQLHQANSSLISSFNLDLRKAQAYENITPISNASLNRDLGAALVSAGANPQVVASLQTHLNELINYDSTQVGSTIAATNDYAILLQEGLDTGRPLAPPALPSLIGSDHNGSIGKIPITHNHTPSLTGNYAYGTNVQIVDNKDGVVLGQGAVEKTTNNYTVRFNNHLPDGIYNVRVRGEDDGYTGVTSPKYTFEVVTPQPKTK